MDSIREKVEVRGSSPETLRDFLPDRELFKARLLGDSPRFWGLCANPPHEGTGVSGPNPKKVLVSQKKQISQNRRLKKGMNTTKLLLVTKWRPFGNRFPEGESRIIGSTITSIPAAPRAAPPATPPAAPPATPPAAPSATPSATLAPTLEIIQTATLTAYCAPYRQHHLQHHRQRHRQRHQQHHRQHYWECRHQRHSQDRQQHQQKYRQQHRQLQRRQLQHSPQRTILCKISAREFAAAGISLSKDWASTEVRM